MYEINGTEMWIMIVEESNYSYSYGTSRLGGTYIEMNSSSFIFYYYNLTYDIEVVLGIPTTNNALRTVTQLAPNSFSYWNVSTIPLARAKFAEHFSATSDSWMRGAYGDYYEFDEENNTKALDYIS